MKFHVLYYRDIVFSTESFKCHQVYVHPSNKILLIQLQCWTMAGCILKNYSEGIYSNIHNNFFGEPIIHKFITLSSQ